MPQAGLAGLAGLQNLQSDVIKSDISTLWMTTICSLPRPHQESGEKFLAAAKAASTTELFVELAEGATAATGKKGGSSESLSLSFVDILDYWSLLRSFEMI